VGTAGGSGVGSGAGGGTGTGTGSGVGAGGVGGSVASVGTGPGGVGGTNAASSVSAQEEAMLRLYLGDITLADNVMAGNLSTMQTASLLYRSGHKRAAKELLCERRDIYNAFRRTATPCVARADWELKETLSLRSPATAAATQPAFQASAYKSRSDCLTAAYTARAPLSSCDGR
jgi:hypothetical protein